MQYYKHTARRPVPTGIPCAGVMPTAPVTPPPIPDSTVSSNPMMGFPLAMAYVPYQSFDDLNEPCKALEQGTLFRALYKPFYGQKRGGV